MSPLPVYQVEELTTHEADGSRSMYVVTCPRCSEEHWVSLKWAVLRQVEGADGQMASVYGRVCPWCSKTSAIPEGIRRMRSVTTRRRTVKIRKMRALGECPRGTPGCKYADCSEGPGKSCYGPAAPRHLDMGR